MIYNIQSYSIHHTQTLLIYKLATILFASFIAIGIRYDSRFSELLFCGRCGCCCVHPTNKHDYKRYAFVHSEPNEKSSVQRFVVM